MPKICAQSVLRGNGIWARRRTETAAGCNGASTAPRGFGILAALWPQGRAATDERSRMTGPQATPAPPPRLIVVLVLATALGPFAMQVFLPALPAIQAGFGVSAATAQLSFSLSAFAIAVSTLFYGPVSDRLGRRPALLGGLVIYLVGSLLCAAAPSISLLIIGRIVQAAGGCAGLVLCRAIIRDLYSLDRSAAVLAYVLHPAADIVETVVREHHQVERISSLCCAREHRGGRQAPRTGQNQGRPVDAVEPCWSRRASHAHAPAKDRHGITSKSRSRRAHRRSTIDVDDVRVRQRQSRANSVSSRPAGVDLPERYGSSTSGVPQGLYGLRLLAIRSPLSVVGGTADRSGVASPVR